MDEHFVKNLEIKKLFYYISYLKIYLIDVKNNKINKY